VCVRAHPQPTDATLAVVAVPLTLSDTDVSPARARRMNVRSAAADEAT
jgi:hypothetical protein